MWQIYGLMALDLINARRREAEAERRARRAGSPQGDREPFRDNQADIFEYPSRVGRANTASRASRAVIELARMPRGN